MDAEVKMRLAGLTFIDLALSALCKKGRKSDEIRLATIYTWTGVELLFKDLLHAEHWTLVIDSADKANAENYKIGKFQTVGFDACLSRLAGVIGIGIKKLEKQKLESLRRQRNRLVHSGLMDTDNAHIGTIFESMTVILTFIDRHHSNLSLEEKKIQNNIIASYSKVQEFVQSKWEQIRSKIEKSENISFCARCEQLAVSLRKSPKCLFCETSYTLEEYAEWFWTAMIDDMRIELTKAAPLIRCPKCKSVSAIMRKDVLVCLAHSHEEDDWEPILDVNCELPPSHGLAFGCSGEIENCPSCGDNSVHVGHCDGDAIDFGDYYLCFSCNRVRIPGYGRLEEKYADDL